MRDELNFPDEETKKTYETNINKLLRELLYTVENLEREVNDIYPSKNSAMRVFNTRLREAKFWLQESIDGEIGE